MNRSCPRASVCSTIAIMCAPVSSNRPEQSRSSLEQLKRLKARTNWAMAEDRSKFMPKCYSLIKSWVGPPPNFQHIFHNAEMNFLLMECVTHESRSWNYLKRKKTLGFVIGSGYKDERELKVGEDGKPILRRCTAILWAAPQSFYNKVAVMRELFKIYDKFDVNYHYELNTHFHTACAWGCDDAVQKFLEAGQDPNCFMPKVDILPLNLAVKEDRRKVTELLLKNGADPNKADAQGLTPLHFICQRDKDDDLIELFFKICDDEELQVDVNAKDKANKTPLQYVDVRCMTRVAEVLLRRGAFVL
ncbi:unnamed protein product [Trichogramma brassicae]|uniref:Uncharacterized protein n=1 Tax=Trichogramma brassicae TaxID=86971 RepID=A0A6H5HVK5_9HYME|nr:unnamed protein product [Trichogramma brassicae]